MNLAWKLASVIKAQSPPSLLASYTAERLPIIQAMLNKTRELHYRTVAADANEDVWKRGESLTMLGINYRFSPIVLDTVHKVDNNATSDPYETSGEVCAGDRAPDAPELRILKGGPGDEPSLYKIFSYTRHTALLFIRDANIARSIVDQLKVYGDRVAVVVIVPQGFVISAQDLAADCVLEDEAGHAYTAYLDLERPFTAIIVRPDTYIGAIVGDGEGLHKYFGKIYL